jgi:hypothetical protein
MDNIEMEANLILLRHQRDERLKETDKYMLNDFPIDENDLIKIKEYRQALRDYMNLPDVINYSSNIPLPDFPDFPF